LFICAKDLLVEANAKKLVDRLSTKSEVEDRKSVTSSAQPNGCPPTP
jgi:hypothetical protein